MDTKNRTRRERGFTLIELMIVIAIIGILSSVTILLYMGLTDKAREGTIKGCLGAIRTALVVYYGDHDGFYPCRIDPAWPGADGAYGGIIVLFPFSAYLPEGELPYCNLRKDHPNCKSSVCEIDDVANVGPNGAVGGWLYRSVNDENWGRIWINSTGLDTKGTPYSSY
ncbi:TPA: hypothetical protein DCX15_02515 [bacterium]|nr:hypothetical protein [bacterium]